jgi:hypothetical protein
MDVALATRHGKESLFAPRLAPLGYAVVVAPVDTDAFGTFTGDVARVGSARDVAIAKAQAAIDNTSLPCGLASEGSFAPHADVPWVTIDTELVAFVDARHDLAVVESSTAVADVPAAFHCDVDAEIPSPLVDGLPDQALIARPRALVSDAPGRGITKGITTAAALHAALRHAAEASESGMVTIEPDLRAHRCPARRVVIGLAVDRLARRLATPCPGCGAVGYGDVRTWRTIACRVCGTPTGQAEAATLGCVRCEHAEALPLSSGADPAVCPCCNP